MTYDIRLATTDDVDALARLSSESFGYPVSDHPHPDPQATGRTTYVAAHQGRIVACVVHRRYDSWFWGTRVPTAGIAGVKVATEHRGNGLLTPLFERCLSDASSEGRPVSTLYPTAPGIYRRFGYELFASYDHETVLPTAALAQVRPGAGSLRRAELADVPKIRRVYDEWARAYNGPLTRDGASFPATDSELLEAFSGATLALDEAGGVVGYALWERTGGYGADGVLDVRDLVTLTADATRLLARALGSSAGVAPTTVLSTSPSDLLDLVLPSSPRTVRRAYPYMLAVLDVAGALTSRGFAEILDGTTTFAVEGLPLSGQDGTYALTVDGGRTSVERTDAAPAATFTARGLALRFAGTHSNLELRRAGLLTGPTGDDARWDALFSGRTPQVRDYF